MWQVSVVLLIFLVTCRVHGGGLFLEGYASHPSPAVSWSLFGHPPHEMNSTFGPKPVVNFAPVYFQEVFSFLKNVMIQTHISFSIRTFDCIIPLAVVYLRLCL